MLGEELLADDAAGTAFQVAEGVAVRMERCQAGAGGAEQDKSAERHRHRAAGDTGADGSPGT
ncbi:MAG: hypothetical protein M0005_04415 [Actinomycetota bacterium]|nr:hypothetical protein [Actinomycetota bacterium]